MRIRSRGRRYGTAFCQIELINDLVLPDRRETCGKCLSCSALLIQLSSTVLVLVALLPAGEAIICQNLVLSASNLTSFPRTSFIYPTSERQTYSLYLSSSTEWGSVPPLT